MALTPVSAFDAFNRSVAGSFGTASSGNVWTNANINYNVDGTQGTIFVPSTQAGRNVLLGIDTPRTKMEVLCKVMWDGSNPLTSHGPALRISGGLTSYYYASIEGYYGEMAIQLIDGTGTRYEQDRTTVSIASNTWYWVRFRSDSVLSLRIWADGTAEPGTWNLQTPFFDGSYPPGAGVPGYFVRGMGESYSVKIFDYYWYSTTVDDTPSWPITDTFNRGAMASGLGMTDTNHLWEGNLGNDPTYYTRTNVGATDGSTGVITKGSTIDDIGFLGDPQSGDQGVLAKFKFDSTTSTTLQLGLRGAFSASSGSMSWTAGYTAKVGSGSTQFVFAKNVAGTVTNPTITSPTAYTALVANTYYWARFQIVGTTLQARLWADGATEPTTWNATTTDSAITSGKAYIVRSQTTSSARTVNIDSIAWGNPVIASPTNATTVGSLTSTSATDTSLTCQAAFTNDANSNNTLVVKYHTIDDSTWTTFAGTKTRGTGKYTFTITGLSPNTVYVVEAIFSDSDGIAGTSTAKATLSTSTNGTDISSSVFTITALTPTTLTVYFTYSFDTNNNNSCKLEKSIFGSGTYTTITSAMTKTTLGGLPVFMTNVTGLTADTEYILRVTVTDSDGVVGTNPQSTTVTTLGKSVTPLTLNISTTDTTATINASYQYDTNNNSSASFKYRAVQDALYTAVPPTNVSTDRTAKTIITTLFPLRPAQTYEVVATFTDPDGISVHIPATLTSLFTTTGVANNTDAQGKKYVWKIYNNQDVYVGTWPDAGEPQFSYELNGGVTDMTITLPRPISEINTSLSVATIAFENRVDIWAIDGTSDGMGPNLCLDDDMDLGSWTLGTSWSINASGGPDGSNALQFNSGASTIRTTRSESMYPFGVVPMVFKMIVKATSTKAKMYVESYDATNTLIEQSNAFAETVDSTWQTLRIVYTPPFNVSYVRLCIENEGSGTILADKCSVLPQEYMCYRGRIETFAPKIDSTGESVDVTILGIVSLLSNDYIEFLQYVLVQPTKDANAQRPNQGAADPGQMMRDIIDLAGQQNSHFVLYYDATSVQDVGLPVEYTFRNVQIRTCFDAIKNLAPPDWGYYIEPDGKVIFRGPELAQNHNLTIGVHLSAFTVSRSISNLHNYITILGREDDNFTQTDGYGTIQATAFDQASIDLYGKRYVILRDDNITTPATAQLVANGRLVEYNREEDKGTGTVLDEKSLVYTGGALLGYNIESFRPGDTVYIFDPKTGTKHNYWDQLVWDIDTWDDKVLNPLPTYVPIVSIDYAGSSAAIQLSEREPTQTGAFAKLYRYQQNTNTSKESSI